MIEQEQKAKVVFYYYEYDQEPNWAAINIAMQAVVCSGGSCPVIIDNFSTASFDQIPLAICSCEVPKEKLDKIFKKALQNYEDEWWETQNCSPVIHYV